MLNVINHYVKCIVMHTHLLSPNNRSQRYVV